MAYITSELGPTKGFHPISRTTIHLPEPQKSYESCTLHLHHTLPALVFVDTHELAQWSESYVFKHWGSRDLEKPVHALPDEVSELLLTVRLSNVESEIGRSQSDDAEKENGKDVHIEVPMHLRYGAPRSTSSAYESIRVDWPQGFLSCPPSSNVHVSSAHNIPYISRMLYAARGMAGKVKDVSLPEHVLSVLPPDNVLITIPPHSDFSDTSSVLYLPVGNTNDLAFVEPLTALTILACCFWLFRVAKKTAGRLSAPRPKTS